MYSVQYVPSIASPQLTQQPISRHLAQCQEKLLHWRDGPLKNRVRRSGIFLGGGDVVVVHIAQLVFSESLLGFFNGNRHQK